MTKLSHIDATGAATMVDIGAKSVTERVAVAAGEVAMMPATLAAIMAGGLPKGDVLAVARVAGIQAAKKCADLIPLCHPLALNTVAVDFEAAGNDTLRVTATCKVAGRTGVEMEALTAVSVAALTVYDMCKAADKSMIFNNIRLISKTGGKSGEYHAEG